MRKAVYAGSFDPITNGHLWMIEQGARLFDELVVAVGVNPEKRSTFPVSDRLAMLRECTASLKNLRIESFENQFLVRYAAAVGAKYILRGIRSEGDHEYERTMRHINSDLSPEIVTVFLIPPREIAEVSSSMVKGLIGPAGWQELVRKYVPPTVLQRLTKKFGGHA